MSIGKNSSKTKLLFLFQLYTNHIMDYVIYKASGGLAHTIIGLSHAIQLAKRNQASLIIDCKQHTAFAHYFSEWFYIDDCGLDYDDKYLKIKNDKNYMNIPLFHNLSINAVKNNKISFVKGDYYLENINITQMPIFQRIAIVTKSINMCTIWNFDIKVNDDVKNKIMTNYKEITQKYMSVHFRNTDIKNDVNTMIRKIKNVIKLTKINVVYLATDDYSAFDKIQKSIKDAEIIQYTNPEEIEKKYNNIHYGTKNKYKVIFECLVDMYIILNSNIFIPSINSGLSQWIMSMIKAKKNIFNIKNTPVTHLG